MVAGGPEELKDSALDECHGQGSNLKWTSAAWHGWATWVGGGVVNLGLGLKKPDEQGRASQYDEERSLLPLPRDSLERRAQLPPPPHTTKVLYIEVGGMVGCKYEAGVKRGGGQKNFV